LTGPVHDKGGFLRGDRAWLNYGSIDDRAVDLDCWEHFQDSTNLDIGDYLDWTLLHIAIRTLDIAIYEREISYGSWHSQNRVDIAELLLKGDAKLRVADNNERRPLHFAAQATEQMV